MIVEDGDLAHRKASDEYYASPWQSTGNLPGFEFAEGDYFSRFSGDNQSRTHMF